MKSYSSCVLLCLPPITPLALSTVLAEIQTHFDTKFRKWNFWCAGEVLSCKIVKGRVYLELAEYDAHHVLIASMKAIIRDEELLAVFLHAHGMVSPNEIIGQTLLFEATCGFHPQWGLSLRIESLSHTFTRGKQIEQKEELRNSLKKRGLYAANTRTQFGLPPVRLAIISAKEAEGLRDFLSILEQSVWDLTWKLFPATMHGEPAKQEVAVQLEQIAFESQSFTAVVITRGGGAKEGLARQNDARIAELICQMPIPVILATGHTVDTSLLDELVWHAAKTPSDAAHLILDGYEQTAARVEDLYARITQKVQSRTDRLADEIASLRSGVRLLSRRQIERIALRVDQMRTGVQAHDPILQTHRGFAIVRDSTDAVVTRETIKTLVSGDQLSIEVFGEKLQVVIMNDELKYGNFYAHEAKDEGSQGTKK